MSKLLHNLPVTAELRSHPSNDFINLESLEKPHRNRVPNKKQVEKMLPQSISTQAMPQSPELGGDLLLDTADE
jgi:hypothetical protein